MKMIGSIAILFAVLQWSSLALANDIKLHGVVDSITGRHVVCSVSKMRIMNTPSWTGIHEPPLSVSNAVTTAVVWLQRMYGSEAVGQVEGCELERVLEEGVLDRWFYRIDIASSPPSARGLTPWHGEVIVLMDGQVVNPMLQQSNLSAAGQP